MKYLNENYYKLMNTIPENIKVNVTMKQEVDLFMADFSDSPEKISRWGHSYFCNDDGGRLIFDLNKPHTHICEVCGKEYKGSMYDGVWVYFYRNRAVLTALESAAVYKATNEKKYLDYSKEIIMFYAKTYSEYPLHNKENEYYTSYEDMKWGCGKMMPQGLNESIVAIRFVQAIELLKDELDQAFITEVYEKMFKEMFKLLAPQVNEVHNIRVWNLAAIGMMGLLMNDKEMIDFTFNSQFNIGVQLKQGVTSDYFWYEGSIHYNFFLLEGVCYLFLFSKLFDYDFGSENTEIYENMLKKAYYFAFDNNYFPNPNDGWPNLNLKTYSYIYHTAAKAFGPNSEMANIVKNIENKPGIRTKLPLSEPYYCNNEFCLERLLFNIDYDYNNYTKLTRESYNCPKSNYSMLRDGRMNAFIKYGLNGKSHAHPDIMNVEITYDGKRVSRDLSNAGYISKLCKSWHRKSVSHNTVVFNAKDMTSVAPGQTLEFDDNHISVIGKNIYTGIQDGIDYKRSISIKENEFNDTFEVKSSIEGTFDYVFHFEEAVKFLKPDNMVDVTLGFDTCGYEYIENVQKLNEETDCVVLKAKLNEYEVTIEIDTSDKKELYFCKTMDNPVNFTRSTIIVRSRSNNPVFKMTITFSNDYNFE